MADDIRGGPLFSYWSGPVSWMERLSVETARAVGYDVTVYSFDPDVLDLPCRIADARDVMPTVTDAVPAHFSDIFRLQGIAKGMGTWFDLDIVFLKPLPPEKYLFGWERADSICNAVLRMPPDSLLLSEYLALASQRGPFRSAPWYSWRKRLSRAIRREPLPIYGPRALTWLVRKHGLDHLAQPCSVLYPVRPSKHAVADMIEWPAGHIMDETVCVHLWRKYWRKIHGAAVPTWAVDGTYTSAG